MRCWAPTAEDSEFIWEESERTASSMSMYGPVEPVGPLITGPPDPFALESMGSMLPDWVESALCSDQLLGSGGAKKEEGGWWLRWPLSGEARVLLMDPKTR